VPQNQCHGISLATAALKELARRHGPSAEEASEMGSRLLRSALTGATPKGVHQATPPPAVAGNRSFPALAGQLVTIE